MKKILGSVLLLIGAFLPGLSSGQGSELDKAVGELADKLAFSRKGEVVGIEGDTIYISLGWQEGVLEGTKFEVVRLGELLKRGDQILGYKETPLAEVEVIRAREKTAIAKVVKKSGDIKEGDRVYELRKKITRVAVTEFPFRDNFNALTRSVQDILHTNLIQKGITMVEREKLEEVLREQKTGTSGVIDLSTAAQMGKLLGVEAVVVGSISDLGNSLAIIGRLVDVEKGVALSAARVELAKTPMLADLAKTDSRASRLERTAEPRAPGSVRSKPDRVTDGNLSAELREDQPEWVINGNNYNLVNSQLSSQDLFTAYVGDSSWDNYAVEFDVKQLDHSDYHWGVLIRRQSDRDYVGLQLSSRHPGSRWVLAKEGKETVVVNSQMKHDCAGHYRIEVEGNRYKLFKDGSQMFVFNNNTFANGGVGLKSVGGGFGGIVTFSIDNFKVVSLRR